MIDHILSRTPATLLLYASVGAAFWLLAVALYRITLHPLARFPGPKLAAATGWYCFVPAAQGRNHLWLQRLHEQYGDAVRFGPDKLAYRTSDALYDIYGDRKANNIKCGFTDVNALVGGSVNLQSLTDKHAHAQRRRTVAHAFTDDALRSAEKFVVNRVKIFCDLLGQGATEKDDGWTPAQNMKTWLQFLTMDILGDLCFGQSFNSLEKYENPVPGMVDAEVKLETMLSTLPICSAILNLLTWLNNMFGTSGLELFVGPIDFHATIGRMVQERMALETEGEGGAADTKRRDMFHYLLTATDPETGNRLEMVQLVKEAGLLLGAGFDTSAANMDACLWYLSRNPSKLKKLQSQVRAKFANVDEICSGPALSSLTYLRACLDESLRMSPPVLGLLERQVQSGGMSIEGQYVPAGTRVTSAAYTIHHNEEYFPDAWTYKPERWRSSESDPESTASEEQIQQAKKAFFAFSAGPRNCIGKNLAYMMMTITMARLLYLYDIRLQPGDRSGEGNPSLDASTGRHRKGEYQLEDYFLNRRAGTRLQLRSAKQ